jgi:hypothetical protein
VGLTQLDVSLEPKKGNRRNKKRATKSFKPTHQQLRAEKNFPGKEK